ncbi:MAG: endonuclease MutS2 [Dethiobacteria bacterium]|jgi:DNA mismatch repair protein MutS2|nr:endonuclease MutS2 [Bacillota bacterium]NMD32877.1 endonuclease MutS2 [Bacillota bacterium]HOB28921.1 endonuclease MutS2 [Bacillota bacterium]HPZ41485.1 endonuclease MutS2 [Bacillota bacterium]HQD52437.1 endonuclease MutS2 [Bacillota bacterium]
MKEIITAREIEALEFDEIRRRLAALTVTPMGRKAAKTLLPSADRAVVERRLRETSEGRLLCTRTAFSPPPVEEISPLVGRAEKGGTLLGDELAIVGAFLKGVRRWQRLFKDADNADLYPLLGGLVSSLDGCADLARELARCINPEGQVLDKASPALASLRHRERLLQEKIREKLDSYLRNPARRRFLQEALITIRGNRFVLPVKQEYRQHIDGVVHDQSASGATLFIEPLPVVQLQNELTGVRNEAEREIERILRELSSRVAAASALLIHDCSVYGRLDLVVACGRLSLEQNAAPPQLLLDSRPQLYLEQARHPLLETAAVPLTVTMGEGCRVLVITGPNTGGKTVTLKTIGLLAVMAQSGLHIPAERNSLLSVFETIRADIGDEQSIEQSLSTFSGHFKNIISILEEHGPASLALLDELGAGTDPSEGAALAMAILSTLARRGGLSVATTHINELKLFAQVQEGMQNAAMEFDQETLAPTYRLLQGIPGSSNALAIAEKLGLSPAVLAEAKSYLSRGHEEVETVITSLVRQQQRLARESCEASREREKAAALRYELEQDREKLRARQEEILKEARDEARILLRRAKSTSDSLIRELRRLQAEGGDEVIPKAEEARRSLQQLRREIETELEPEEAPALPAAELAVGKTVFVQSLQQKGEVLSLADDQALVQVGTIRVHLPQSELRRWEERPAPSGSPPRSSYTVQKESEIRPEINLQGKTVEEAIPLVDKLLDDALWAGLGQVTLIHGKGTGRLKEGLRDYLRAHPLVKSMRSGVAGEGGSGVTVVILIGGPESAS